MDDVERTQPVLRVADIGDADLITALQRRSIAALFPAFYDERQTRSAVEYIAHVDLDLVRDGTYFVLEADGQIVGCGGWSRRNRLYTGSGASTGDERLLDSATEAARIRAMFVRADWTRRGLGRKILDACEDAARQEGYRRLELLATLPGILLYEAFGFAPTGPTQEIALEDGVVLACLPMAMEIREPSNSAIREHLIETAANT